MIRNDIELKATQERIAHFEEILRQLHVKASAKEFTSASSGYKAELIKMQDEVMEYLTRHASVTVPG